MQKVYYASEVPADTVEAIRNAQPSKASEKLNYLLLTQPATQTDS